MTRTPGRCEQYVATLIWPVSHRYLDVGVLLIAALLAVFVAGVDVGIVLSEYFRPDRY